VLQIVRDRGALSRTDLAKISGLSKPTVKEVVESLLDAGYLMEKAPSETEQAKKPGRRPRLVEFRSDLGHVVGIDIGANKILAAVADLTGQVLAMERRPTSSTIAENVLSETRNAVALVLRTARITQNSVVAAAVGTPGAVDAVTGAIRLAPQLPGWSEIDLHGALRNDLVCPIFVDNEVRLAVLAERWHGSARASDEALLVHVGYGIGAGILIGGEIYRGSSGAAGEIGSLSISDAPPPGAGLGQFEFEAGGMAYARVGKEAAKAPDAAILCDLVAGDRDRIDAAVIFEASRLGCPAASRVLHTLIDRLARGVASAVMLLDPGLVVIGGGVSRAGNALLHPLQESIAALVPNSPPIVLSTLGEEAVALGAIHLALEEADRRLLGIGPDGAVLTPGTLFDQGVAQWQSHPSLNMASLTSSPSVTKRLAKPPVL
jgi:predicted NBD/HSP70 family sugar kinase